jgi:hypothetical protein
MGMGQGGHVPSGGGKRGATARTTDMAESGGGPNG